MRLGLIGQTEAVGLAKQVAVLTQNTTTWDKFGREQNMRVNITNAFSCQFSPLNKGVNLSGVCNW